MKTAAIQSGFRKTDIFPINPEMIKRSSLAPSSVTDNMAHLEGKEMFCVEIVFQN